MLYTVKGDRWVNVRAAPSLTAPIIGGVATGAVVSSVAENASWITVNLKAGDNPMILVDGSMALERGYMSKTVLASAQPPPPLPVTTLPLIGVNVIFRGEDAQAAIDNGCGYISVTFNPDLAWQLKQRYPDLVVSARANYYRGGIPDLSAIKDKLGPAIRPGVIVLGLNEQDQIGADESAIGKRAQFDSMMLKMCQDVGAKYAGAGFGMGIPDVTKPSICDAIIQSYTPLIQQGMIWNQHTYGGNDGSRTPLKERIFSTRTWEQLMSGHMVTMRQTVWLEERDKLYTALCGFPESTLYINDETGVDDNPGGFPAWGYKDEEVAAWCKEWQRKNAEPVLFDGKVVAFHKIGGALFQAGNDIDWAGYEVRQFFPALKAAGVFSRKVT